MNARYGGSLHRYHGLEMKYPLSSKSQAKRAKGAGLAAAIALATAPGLAPGLAFAQTPQANALENTNEADTSEASRADLALAAITFNFARFIQWRDADERARRDNFAICVIDEDPSAAWRTLEGKTVDARKVALLYRDEILSLSEQCDMAYVSSAQQKLYSMRDLAKGGVVTISDSTRFASNGGEIEFSLADNRATFDINEQALSRAGARVSSKLMRVGMRVSVSDS